MNNEILYPKNIDNLLKKVDYIIKNEQNQDKISEILNWITWFKSLNYNLKYICKKNEYLKFYVDEDKYALQLWKHNDNIDLIKFNLISNYYSEYDNSLTEVVIK